MIIDFFLIFISNSLFWAQKVSFEKGISSIDDDLKYLERRVCDSTLKIWNYIDN